VRKLAHVIAGFASGAPLAVKELPIPWSRSNGALLNRILAESGVDRSPARPGWTSYVEAWAGAFTRWLNHLLGRNSGVLSGVVEGVALMAWILAGGAVILLALWAWRWVAKRSARDEVSAPQVRERALETSSTLTPQEWRAELEHNLSSGDVVGALKALWWWVARSVAGDAVDESWTSEQLLAASRRLDLKRGVATLDRMLYGARRPEVEEVRVLFGQLAKVVP
jgi:hypothetical protein